MGRPYETDSGSIARAVLHQGTCSCCAPKLTDDEKEDELQVIAWTALTDTCTHIYTNCSHLLLGQVTTLLCAGFVHESSTREHNTNQKTVRKQLPRLVWQALFCSELVAALYIDAGWLHDSLQASRYLPKDFGVKHTPVPYWHCVSCSSNSLLSLIKTLA